MFLLTVYFRLHKFEINQTGENDAMYQRAKMSPSDSNRDPTAHASRSEENQNKRRKRLEQCRSRPDLIQIATRSDDTHVTLC